MSVLGYQHFYIFNPANFPLNAMKKISLIAVLCAFGQLTQAQNLVNNPSFENTASNCANFGGEGFSADLASTWNSANSNAAGDSCSSPDLFAPCNTVFGISVTGMPDNELGWQQARTGTRYVGIITYDPLSNYREYIQGSTSVPLVAGQQYCVSMFVSRGDNVPFATNNMGVYFSNTEYMRNACPGNSLINVTPQLNYTCAPITDTTNWVRLQWNYTAVGGERYLTIGNFFNNANTTVVNLGGGGLNPYAYYYIDDVSIVASNECCYSSIAAVGQKCLSDAAVTLVASPPIGTDCSPTLTGTWSGPGVNASTGVFTPSVAGTGTHTVNFTLSCGYVASTTITVNACAQLSLCSNANGSLTVSGGSGSYTWQSQSMVQDCSGCPFGNCLFCIGNPVMVAVWTTFATSATATPPGTWPIRVTDGQGGIITLTSATGIAPCESTGCILTLSAGNVVNACDGATGAATVTVSGSIGTVAFAWNTTPIQTAATASNLAAGQYTVTVTDASCARELTFVVQSGAVVADAGEDQIICKGESTTLNASGGISYQWNNGAGNVAQVEVSPGSTTVYTVTATSGTCSDTDEMEVMVVLPPVVNLNIPVTSFCDNSGSYALTGGTPSGGTYSGNGVSNNTFNPTQAGIGAHTITYTYYEFVECPESTTNELTVDLCTGMRDLDMLNSVAVHPNPTNALLTVGLQGLEKAELAITVLDAIGREMMVPMNRQMNSGQASIDLSSLANGLYVVLIQTDSRQSRSFRVIKN